MKAYNKYLVKIASSNEKPGFFSTTGQYMATGAKIGAGLAAAPVIATALPAATMSPKGSRLKALSLFLPAATSMGLAGAGLGATAALPFGAAHGTARTVKNIVTK